MMGAFVEVPRGIRYVKPVLQGWVGELNLEHSLISLLPSGYRSG